MVSCEETFAAVIGPGIQTYVAVRLGSQWFQEESTAERFQSHRGSAQLLVWIFAHRHIYHSSSCQHTLDGDHQKQELRSSGFPKYKRGKGTVMVPPRDKTRTPNYKHPTLVKKCTFGAKKWSGSFGSTRKEPNFTSAILFRWKHVWSLAYSSSMLISRNYQQDKHTQKAPRNCFGSKHWLFWYEAGTWWVQSRECS